MSIPKSAFIRISTVVPDGFALGEVHEIEVKPPSWLVTGISSPETMTCHAVTSVAALEGPLSSKENSPDWSAPGTSMNTDGTLDGMLMPSDAVAKARSSSPQNPVVEGARRVTVNGGGREVVV